MILRCRSLLNQGLSWGGCLAAASLLSTAIGSAGARAEGPKFIRPGDAPNDFKSVPRRSDGCLDIATNVSFCMQDSDWTAKQVDTESQTALFQRNGEVRPQAMGTIHVIAMERDASYGLSNADWEALVQDHVLDNTFHGSRTLVETLEQERSPNGRLIQLKALVSETDGRVVLLQLSSAQLDYGAGFFEVATRWPSEPRDPVANNDELAAFHSFMTATRISVSMN